MLKHPLFRSPKVNAGLAKYEVVSRGADPAVVVAALRSIKAEAEAGSLDCNKAGLCFALWYKLIDMGVCRRLARDLEEWVVFAFTGRELPIMDWEDGGDNWEGEQLDARLELIDALIQDIEA